MSRSTSDTHLFAWVGFNDLKVLGPGSGPSGPIHAAVATGDFVQVRLLANYTEEDSTEYSEEDSEAYRDWLTQQFPNIAVSLETVSLDSPMDYRGIHQAVTCAVDDHRKRYPGARLCFHSSPGTPAMTVVWILLGKTFYEARIIRSHYDNKLKRNVVVDVDFPFNVSAEFIDRITRERDESILADVTLDATKKANFNQIIHRCDEMNRVIERAIQVARRDVPVLIEGESGTGKELLAQAIHNSSPRREKPFVAINCGAIPGELFESELFGHKKGAFTGAMYDRVGAFREAHGGTLFLDEIGELPKVQQVKLLRVLQEKRVRPLGEDSSKGTDVRIICATHRHLYQDVHHGKFREDLFHRLAVGVIKLPALRDRRGDLGIIIDYFLEELCRIHKFEAQRMLSPQARQRLLHHRWPGNIRELRNTLLRAIVWSKSEVLTLEEIENAIMLPPVSAQGVLDHPVVEGFDITAQINELKKHYIERALELTEHNKTKAAKLLGLNNHQTLGSWMDKLGIATTE